MKSVLTGEIGASRTEAFKFPERGRKSPPVFLSDARIEAIRAAMELPDTVMQAAYEQLHEAANVSLDREPLTPESGEWRVPEFYEDETGHRNGKAPLMLDANGAYAMALMFRLTGEELYAERVTCFAMAWAGICNLSPQADSPLAFSCHFPALIFAADLVRSSSAWGEVPERCFVGCMVRIRNEYRSTQSCRWKTWTSDNNWGNWGIVLGMSAAAFLADDEWFAELIERWKELIEIQIDAEGHLPREVTRNQGTGTHGIWYSHFCLQPQTIAAEIARVNGVDLYDYLSPSGSTLRQAYEEVIKWVEDPACFPYFKRHNIEELHHINAISYFELLHARWPNDAAQRLLDTHRPLTTNHSNPFTTFTHGTLPLDL